MEMIEFWDEVVLQHHDMLKEEEEEEEADEFVVHLMIH
jgi:hypothetical protein